jgi:hypothetical protein
VMSARNPSPTVASRRLPSGGLLARIVKVGPPLGWLASIAVALGTVAISGVPVATAAASGGCPNEPLRTSFSAGLPECRAYELVSAAGSEPFFGTFGDPNGANIDGSSPGVGYTKDAVAAITGERMAYFSNATPADSPTSGLYYMASRGSTGWSTKNLIPPHSTTTGDLCYNTYTPAYTPDLSGEILADGYSQLTHEGQPSRDCGHDEPLLVPGEPEGFQNLFVRLDETASYQLVDLTPAGVSPNDALFQAASDDLSHVVFEENAKLTPQAPEGSDLYEWAGGAVRLVTLLPDGTPVQGSLADGFYYHHQALHSPHPSFTHALSADGSRVFFVAGGALYEREHADREQSPLDGEGHCADLTEACTFQVDTTHGPGSSGGGTFQWASTDGSRVFFTDESRLTSDSTAVAGKPDLYEYDLEAARLTDLTAASGEPADVLAVSGTSSDGAYVYFVAEGALTGTQANSHGAVAEAGRPNLYLRHAGGTTFIATLEPNEDSCDWSVPCNTVRVSPNGSFVGFNSVNSLTGYDNIDVNKGTADQEIFRYDAAHDQLACVSCNPDAAPPTAPAAIRVPEQDEFALENGTPGYLQRNVLDDGRVFFDTVEGLLPNDANEGSDVYEYQAGELHLISNPTGGGSYFFDASPSGDDVFFATTQHLLASDTGAVSVYDARVNGGFPEAGKATECSEEDCKGPVTAAPLSASPSSATFVGPGNLASAAPKSKAKAKPKAKSLTRAQKLANALKACRKKPKHKRASCEKQARRAAKSSRRGK